MGIFDNLGKKPISEQPFEILEGGFLCDKCWNQADEAKYYSTAGTLVYECPKGHITTIDGFRL